MHLKYFKVQILSAGHFLMAKEYLPHRKLGVTNGVFSFVQRRDRAAVSLKHLPLSQGLSIVPAGNLAETLIDLPISILIWVLLSEMEYGKVS